MSETSNVGLIQVYTGDGKGKTTAALGQAMRACGQGMKVIFIQFLKGQTGGEHYFIEEYHPFEIIQFGKGDILKKSENELLSEAAQALEFSRKSLSSGKYDMVILDEIFIARWRGLISLEQLLKLIEEKPPGVELILTGRKAPAEVIKRADLVTEMLLIKHPFLEGIQQRKGIEY